MRPAVYTLFRGARLSASEVALRTGLSRDAVESLARKHTDVTASVEGILRARSMAAADASMLVFGLRRNLGVRKTVGDVAESLHKNLDGHDD